MKLITENRTEMIRALNEIQPKKFISFGLIDWSIIKDIPDSKRMVIVNTQQYYKHIMGLPISPKWTIRTNNKIHSKIAIGTRGFIIGSWNFTDNSTTNMHEAIIQFARGEFPEIEKQLDEYFEKLWNRSSDV